jgi:RimJ/RimL family protein N-acetyltransferase
MEDQPAMNVTVTRLNSSRPCLNFAMAFFGDPELMKFYPIDEQNFATVYQSVKAIEDNKVIAYAIIRNEKPIGMLWGAPINGTTIHAHWGVFAEERQRGVAQAAVNAALAAIKKDMPEITSVIGFISKCNLQSFAGALKCGFTVQGVLPRTHRKKDGTMLDAWIVVREIE